MSKKMDVKNSVRVATNQNPIANLQETTLFIDSVCIKTSDRILVKDGASIDGIEPISNKRNGIYIVKKIKNGTGQLVRANDANNDNKVTSGMFTFVEEGDQNKDTGWLLTTDNPIELDVTGLEFTNYSSTGEISGSIQNQIDQNTDNIALLAFRNSAQNSLTLQKMVDGKLDEYTDESGIDKPASIDEFHNANDSVYLTGGGDVKLLTHLDGVDGDTSTVDESPDANIISFNGDAKLDAHQGKFATSSGVFSKSGGTYLSIPNDVSTLDLWAQTTTQTHTIDFWAKIDDFTQVTNLFVSQGDDGANAYWDMSYINTGGVGIRYEWRSGAQTYVNDTGYQINDNDFHHFVIRIDGTATNNIQSTYVDGQQISWNSTGRRSFDTNDILIGAFTATNVTPIGATFTGKMNHFRITKGFPFSGPPPSNNLLGTYTVPTSAPVSDANTLVLLNMESDFNDSSSYARTITNVGPVTLDAPVFGSSSLKLDGVGDYLTIPDSNSWDVFASTLDDWSMDCWVRHNNTPTADTTYIHQSDGANGWQLGSTGSSVRLRMFGSGLSVSLTGGSVIDGAYHHILAVKKGTTYGLYVDGTQVAYTVDTDTNTFSSPLTIGAALTGGGSSFDHFKGNIDEVRIEKNNTLNADPNVGLTDTIIVPTSASVAGTVDSTIVSLPCTALAQPETIRTILFHEEVDPTVINTDIEVFVSRDDGVTFTKANLVLESEYATGKKLYADSVDVSSQPAGTEVVYKIVTNNLKSQKIHGMGLFWQ